MSREETKQAHLVRSIATEVGRAALKNSMNSQKERYTENENRCTNTENDVLIGTLKDHEGISRAIPLLLYSMLTGTINSCIGGVLN
jgi:hypothetical protein